MPRGSGEAGRPSARRAYGRSRRVQASVACRARSLEHCYLIDDEGLATAEKTGAFVVPTMQMTREDKALLRDGRLPAHAVWKFQRDLAAIEAAQTRIARSRVKIALGTDCGMFPFSEGIREFEAMVAAGVAPGRARKAGTSVAAELRDATTSESSPLASAPTSLRCRAIPSATPRPRLEWTSS